MIVVRMRSDNAMKVHFEVTEPGGKRIACVAEVTAEL